MIEATVSTLSIWRPTNRRRESAYPARADIATVIRVIRAEVSRLFHAQRGTRPSVSTLMYACRVNPLSGMKVIGCAAASASVLKEVSTAHSTGTSQARARIARITKATMRAGVGRRRRRLGTSTDGSVTGGSAGLSLRSEEHTSELQSRGH